MAQIRYNSNKIGGGIDDYTNIQVPTMPTANVSNKDRIVQYIGATNQTYKNGCFYKCTQVGVSSTYEWDILELPDTPVSSPVSTFDKQTWNMSDGESTSVSYRQDFHAWIENPSQGLGNIKHILFHTRAYASYTFIANKWMSNTLCFIPSAQQSVWCPPNTIITPAVITINGLRYIGAMCINAAPDSVFEAKGAVKIYSPVAKASSTAFTVSAHFTWR